MTLSNVYKLTCGKLEATWIVAPMLLDKEAIETLNSYGNKNPTDNIIAYLKDQMSIPMRIRYDEDYDVYTEDLITGVDLSSWRNTCDVELDWDCEVIS